jgi:2-polyprenyl-6-methoxyphenol hydroxylase-like FAD-dependent oxidoreductase
MTCHDNVPGGIEFPLTTDVLVVGAGATGLSLACGLARQGIDHVLIDHAPQVAANSHTAVIDARTLEILESIDASDPLIRRGVKTTQFTLRDRDDELVALDFSELPTSYPFMLLAPESTAVSVLLERLAWYGSSVMRPMTAVALQQNADGVTVELWDGRTSRSGSPSRRTIFARYVVGCDGMHSQIRSALNIPFVGAPRSECIVMADVRMRWSLPRREVQLFFSASGLLIVAPLPDDRYRIVATTDRTHEYPELEDLQELLATRGPRASPGVVQDVLWSEGLHVDNRLAVHYGAGRVFLAGDAAHVYSPVGGQGMNAGIQDGLHLAEKLSAVLGGRANPSVLNQYERERRPMAEFIQRLTGHMRGMATVRGPASQRIRNGSLRVLARLPAFRRSLARWLSGIDRPVRPHRHSGEGKWVPLTMLVFVALVLLCSFVLLASSRH